MDLDDPRLRRGVEMIRDWWRLHPEDDPDHLGSMVDTEAYRVSLFGWINTASDGELERLFPEPRRLTWTTMVGMAAARGS